MPKAKKKTKMFKVRITRTLTHHAVVEVEAYDAEEAKAVAISAADEGRGYWVEGHIVDEEVDSCTELFE